MELAITGRQIWPPQVDLRIGDNRFRPEKKTKLAVTVGWIWPTADGSVAQEPVPFVFLSFSQLGQLWPDLAPPPTETSRAS